MHRHASLNATSSHGQEAGKQAALLAAVSALRALVELRSAARGRPGCIDAAAEEAFLRTASNILATRQALTLQHGTWVKACLARLAALLQALQHAPQGTFPHLLLFHLGLTSSLATEGIA